VVAAGHPGRVQPQLAIPAERKFIMDSGVSMIETDSESDLGYGHLCKCFLLYSTARGWLAVHLLDSCCAHWRPAVGTLPTIRFGPGDLGPRGTGRYWTRTPAARVTDDLPPSV